MYIVAYDITETKFRNRIAKILSSYGYRVQYSIFECNISVQKLDKLKTKLINEFLNNKNKVGTDNIRIYFVCKACQKSLITIGAEKNEEIKKEFDSVII